MISWSNKYWRIASRFFAVSGIKFSAVGCSFWMSLKTSVAGLLGSMIFPASANASCSRFNSARPISSTFAGGRSTSSCSASMRRYFSSPIAHGAVAFGKRFFLQPGRVLAQRHEGFAIGERESGVQLRIFHVLQRVDQILLQETRRRRAQFRSPARRTVSAGPARDSSWPRS